MTRLDRATERFIAEFKESRAFNSGGVAEYGYRYYEPDTGRWVSRDPIGERGGVNLYRLLANDALTSIDSLGLRDWKRCVELLFDIAKQAALTLSELRKYDPVRDGRGGDTWRHGGETGITTPGGHYNKIKNYQQGLKNRLRQFVGDCIDDKNGPKGGKRFPKWADKLANMSVPPPITLPRTSWTGVTTLGTTAAETATMATFLATVDAIAKEAEKDAITVKEYVGQEPEREVSRSGEVVKVAGKAGTCYLLYRVIIYVLSRGAAPLPIPIPGG